jgi:hypothetical protein
LVAFSAKRPGLDIAAAMTEMMNWVHPSFWCKQDFLL